MKKPPKSIDFPPDHLSPRALELWTRLGPSVGVTGRRMLFITALECLDRCEQARQAIASEGLTHTNPGTGMTHVNPLIKVEIESRRQFARLWSELGLTRKPHALESLFEEQEEERNGK